MKRNLPDDPDRLSRPTLGRLFGRGRLVRASDLFAKKATQASSVPRGGAPRTRPINDSTPAATGVELEKGPIMAQYASRSLATTDRPILRTLDRTGNGYRFRFDYGSRTLILDADLDGRPLDVHLEYPLDLSVPPIAREVAVEQVRRVMLSRRVHNG